MKKIFCLFLAMSITGGLFAQYTIQMKHFPLFRKHKLAILSDSVDSSSNAALVQLVKKYWKGSDAVIVQDQKQINDLEKGGGYVFLRHSARIMQDEKGEFRTDFLDFYDSEWTGQTLATCYTPKTNLGANALYIKFFLKVLENSNSNSDISDSANLCRNGSDLASLRNTVLYIPAHMFASKDANADLAKLETTNLQGASKSQLTVGSYTFCYKLADERTLTNLVKDDTHQVYVANLVSLPDHTTAFYIYDVNAGKVLYKSSQKEALINLTALEDLNMAIMKTRLQSSL